MKKISIINQKGGCGKTSLAVLMCKSLAQKGFKVLAIDCDPQGGMSNFLLPDGFSDGDIVEILMGDIIGNSIYESIYNNIKIIPSNYKLDKLYVSIDHLAFKRTLKDIHEYEYIIFDTPPTMQGITRAAAHVSDMILVPSEVSRSALGPTLYTLQCLKEIEKEGKVVFIGDAHYGFLSDLESEFRNKLNNSYAGAIKKDVTSQKIISGDCKLTKFKIEKYLEPVGRLIDGC